MTPDPPPSVAELLTTRQVAEKLGTSPQMVAYWVRTGRLTPAMRAPTLRGQMFFRPADVDALRVPDDAA